jgi:hypothetical protein
VGGAPASQGQGRADVQIQAIGVTAKDRFVTVRVVVSSDRDDLARNATLHVFIPVGSLVARVPAGCRPSASPTGSLPARVDCDLGEIRVRDLRDVSVVMTAPPAGVARRVAAFAYSDTPDPHVANNYAERVVP